MDDLRTAKVKPGRGALSIRLTREGDPRSRVIVVPRRRLQMYKMLMALCGLGLCAIVASWIALMLRAGEADELQREADLLRARNDSIASLVQMLARLEARDEQIRGLFGSAEQEDAGLWLPAPSGTGRRVGSPVAGDTVTTPNMWPLTEAGFVTQSLLEGAQRDHPGIDIAVPSGSYIRAAGGGEVVEAARDPVYGFFVLIDHGNLYWTRYGHASYLAVERGQKVRQGEVIALTGSSGRSTAPHLHFEILRNGRPVDPMTMVDPP